MIDLIRKSMLAGLGLALKTRDEIEHYVDDLVKKGEMTEKDGKRFFEDLIGRYEESRKHMEERIERIVRDILKRAHVVTEDDLKGLKAEIRELKKALGRETGPQ